VSLSVNPGEIVGLAGIEGNGQSEFLRALAGLERASGKAELGVRRLTLGNPDEARKAGVTYLSANRHSEGLLMRMSVRENAALSALPHFARHGVLRPPRRGRRGRGPEEVTGDRAPRLDTEISALSGGNQQKVMLARSLLAEPSLVLADEPTQGVDAGARVEIYRILRGVAEAGTPVLVVSSDALELRASAIG
jgi:ribose transport system ATP-binding protein